jgi:hypothetical protein
MPHNNTLYTNDVRAFLRSQPWPPTVKWEVREFEEFLRLVFFRDNLNTLTVDEKMHMVTIINDVMNGIRKNGIPIYTEVAKGDGNGTSVPD